MNRTKEEVQEALGLDTLPTDEFMALLAEVGDDDVVTGPTRSHPVRSYEPEEIERVVLDGAVGTLLAHAREEAHRSLRYVASRAGISHARVQQIEQSENLEIATLVRTAGAVGYRVGIFLEPVEPDPDLRTFLMKLEHAY
jgi:hypothetical protein